MQTILLSTGTELLLGDVREAHLSFIAREIRPLGLRIEEQRTVPDGPQIRRALEELFARADLLFVTGGLGPTSDDLTCELVAQALGLKLERSEKLLANLQQQFKRRAGRRSGRWTDSRERKRQRAGILSKGERQPSNPFATAFCSAGAAT
jgi:nicotinamide-nucleotide amidase